MAGARPTTNEKTLDDAPEAKPPVLSYDGLMRFVACGFAGCPLPDRHRGLCQPVIVKRGPQRASKGVTARRPSAYINRAPLVVKEKNPYAGARIMTGESHQASHLPEWAGSAPCRDEREDVILHFKSKAEVAAAFAAERSAAAAWEALGRSEACTTSLYGTSASGAKGTVVVSPECPPSSPDLNDLSTNRGDGSPKHHASRAALLASPASPLGKPRLSHDWTPLLTVQC